MEVNFKAADLLVAECAVEVITGESYGCVWFRNDNDIFQDARVEPAEWLKFFRLKDASDFEGGSGSDEDGEYAEFAAGNAGKFLKFGFLG